MSDQANERTRLLSQDVNGEAGSQHGQRVIEFADDDPENPRAWSKTRKFANVAVIASMALLSPLASSMFHPGINEIATSLHTTRQNVIGATTAFVVTLGLGPLALAPLSETFGRRTLYLACYALFTLLQVPTALSPTVEVLIALRTVAGFVGSVGIANGGGTISDMFPPADRAGVFGWYLLGPLLGPALGPALGGAIVQHYGWRWVFALLAVLCGASTLCGFVFLRETYAPVLLERRKALREKEAAGGGVQYWYEGEDARPLAVRLRHSFSRPVRILTQPIVLTMSAYQALIFSTTYSLYTNFEDIYGRLYGFNTEQVGLVYLAPGLGLLVAVRLLTPPIDDVYNKLTKQNGGVPKPEFRLPLANVGAALLPLSLFSFALLVHYEASWTYTAIATFFYGIGQVVIINCTQNYYIDAFEKYAASAIAAGAVFRSVIGGVIPLLAPAMFATIGYGWGISVFGFLSLVLAPAPFLFYYFGERIRGMFSAEL